MRILLAAPDRDLLDCYRSILQADFGETVTAFDGTQVLYGKLRPYLHNWLNPDFKGVAVGDWWVMRPVGIDKDFLFRLVQTKQFDEVANQSSGSKMSLMCALLLSGKGKGNEKSISFLKPTIIILSRF